MFSGKDEKPDMTSLIQNVIHKCMDSDQLCNEFYLQLIKQTTDHPGNNNAHFSDNNYIVITQVTLITQVTIT